MKILYAAPENAWGGFFGLIRSELPECRFEASGRFCVDSLKGFDVLIPTMCRVTREMIRDAHGLRLIQQCGSGLEGVDLEAAREFNVRVANVPTHVCGNADSVAELGIFMIIGLSRNMRGMAQSLAAQKMGEPQGRALSGRTVGLVGLGGIARALIARLKGFHVRVIGIRRRKLLCSPDELGLEWIGGPEDLKELLAMSDYVVLCLPLSAGNERLIDDDAFSCMKREAFLINLSRGGLVDRDALERALALGKIAGAGLDVYWEEPPDPNDPIFRHNVLATPHIAGSTDVSMSGIVRVVAENIRRVSRNEEPLHQA